MIMLNTFISLRVCMCLHVWVCVCSCIQVGAFSQHPGISSQFSIPGQTSMHYTIQTTMHYRSRISLLSFKTYTIPGYGAVRASLPPEYGSAPFANMKPGERRHLAWTFNHVSDVSCVYVDGIELRCEQQNTGSIADMDCDMNDPNTAYVGLNHRIPGAYQTNGPVQDWRYYREALTADQVRTLAYESVDGDGNNLRFCVLKSEGEDTDFVDVNGHDCAWYQETRKVTPSICSAAEVQTNCPLACDVRPRCWDGFGQDQPSTHYIWNKIMLLKESIPGEGMVCVREGIDAVKECRKMESDPSTAVIPPGAMAWTQFGMSVNFVPMFA